MSPLPPAHSSAQPEKGLPVHTLTKSMCVISPDDRLVATNSAHCYQSINQHCCAHETSKHVRMRSSRVCLVHRWYLRCRNTTALRQDSSVRAMQEHAWRGSMRRKVTACPCSSGEAALSSAVHTPKAADGCSAACRSSKGNSEWYCWTMSGSPNSSGRLSA